MKKILGTLGVLALLATPGCSGANQLEKARDKCLETMGTLIESSTYINPESFCEYYEETSGKESFAEFWLDQKSVDAFVVRMELGE